MLTGMTRLPLGSNICTAGRCGSILCRPGLKFLCLLNLGVLGLERVCEIVFPLRAASRSFLALPSAVLSRQPSILNLHASEWFLYFSDFRRRLMHPGHPAV